MIRTVSSTRVSTETHAARSTSTKEKKLTSPPSRRSFAKRSPSTVPASRNLRRKRSPEGFRQTDAQISEVRYPWSTTSHLQEIHNVREDADRNACGQRLHGHCVSPANGWWCSKDSEPLRFAHPSGGIPQGFAFFEGFDLPELLKATAWRMSALKADSSTSSPSWMSIARRAFPSRLELKRRSGSFRDAPLEKVSFTTFL